MSEKEIVREFFKSQRKEQRALPKFSGYVVTRKEVPLLLSRFKKWLAKEPADKVYDYFESCPLAQFAQSLFPDKWIFGDTDRFFVKNTDTTFDAISIPKELQKGIESCVVRTGEDHTVVKDRVFADTAVINSTALRKVFL